MIGLNCLQPFGWGFPFRNGGTDLEVMPNSRLDTLVKVGFDFVRIAIDPEVLLSADGGRLNEVTELKARLPEIVEAVRRRVNCGLRVIVDMHFHGDVISYAPGWSWCDVLKDDDKAAHFRDVVTHIGSAIAAHFDPSDVCFEFFNEPPPPSLVGTDLWLARLHLWWSAVRTAMPAHTIVVAGNNYNAFDSAPAGERSGCTSLNPLAFDYNTGFAIHDYDSPIFTHQGVLGTPFHSLSRVHYPADKAVGGKARLMFAFLRSKPPINAWKSVLNPRSYASIQHYYEALGDKAKRENRMKVVTNWADQAGISRKRILQTECGVNFGGRNTAPIGDTAAWLRDTREIAAEAGINCITVHEAQGSGFGIQNADAPWTLKNEIASALFS